MEPTAFGGGSRADPFNGLNMPTIELWESVGLGVILEFKSGVAYSTQTGGTATLHPSVEGVFIPLRNSVNLKTRELRSPENDLWDYFAGPKHRGTGATGGLDSEDADFVDAILAKWGLDSFTRVDRERLRDSHEAWVRVVVSDDEGMVFKGFQPYPRPGVLTWSNTD